jgi:hypothetical protein
VNRVGVGRTALRQALGASERHVGRQATHLGRDLDDCDAPDRILDRSASRDSPPLARLLELQIRLGGTADRNFMSY